jgi:hypothetical protein
MPENPFVSSAMEQSPAIQSESADGFSEEQNGQTSADGTAVATEPLVQSPVEAASQALLPERLPSAAKASHEVVPAAVETPAATAPAPAVEPARFDALAFIRAAALETLSTRTNGA